MLLKPVKIGEDGMQKQLKTNSKPLSVEMMVF
jgi:hypothetical protein